MTPTDCSTTISFEQRKRQTKQNETKKTRNSGRLYHQGKHFGSHPFSNLFVRYTAEWVCPKHLVSYVWSYINIYFLHGVYFGPKIDNRCSCSLVKKIYCESTRVCEISIPNNKTSYLIFMNRNRRGRKNITRFGFSPPLLPLSIIFSFSRSVFCPISWFLSLSDFMYVVIRLTR